MCNLSRTEFVNGQDDVRTDLSASNPLHNAVSIENFVERSCVNAALLEAVKGLTRSVRIVGERPTSFGHVLAQHWKQNRFGSENNKVSRLQFFLTWSGSEVREGNPA
jgi:hypothetical protein